MSKRNLQERKIVRKRLKGVVGLDEAGRGALAGPVMAAAVIIKIPNFIRGPGEGWEGEEWVGVQIPKLRDSKRLSPNQREKIYKFLINHPAIKWGVGMVSEKVIDKINILEATKLAMKRAIKRLKMKNEKLRIDYLIVDGNFKLNLSISQRSIVKADEKILPCTLASIIAKVTRDKMMKNYHKKYPQYGFDKNKGYGTRYHLKALKKFGRCAIHRKSFHYGRAKTKTY